MSAHHAEISISYIFFFFVLPFFAEVWAMVQDGTEDDAGCEASE